MSPMRIGGASLSCSLVTLLVIAGAAAGCRRDSSGHVDPGGDSRNNGDDAAGGDGLPSEGDSTNPGDSTPDDDGDDGGGGGGGDEGDGGGDVDAGFAEYAECFSPEDCKAGLDCVDTGARSYCLLPCAGAPNACSGTQRCEAGYCRRGVDYYDLCDGRTQACPADAMCFTSLLEAPSRCVPVCASGDLGLPPVAQCPTLPSAITTATVSCTPGIVATTTASFCTAEVAVGSPCDRAALQCNAADLRPDTDLVNEASGGGRDPGALVCIPTPDWARCLRVCSTDGGATKSACTCPPGDPACSEPAQGAAWDCLRWPGLQPAGLLFCVALEACDTNAAACDDNLASGSTSCRPTPYESGPAKICQRPLP